MANITEVSQWENVIRQIENGEAATGGADGLANVQAKQLANRTQWLKGNLAPIVNAAFRGTLKHEGSDLAGSAITGRALTEGTGYVKYASGFIIQWGHLEGTALQKITMPITFQTLGTILVTPIQSSQTSRTAWVGDIELNSFTIRQSANGGVMWFAIGSR